MYDMAETSLLILSVSLFYKLLLIEIHMCMKKIGKYTFSIILTQGLNRQIRRMCEALGYEVKDLLRVRVMNITLDGLKDGQYRKLTDQELNELYDQLKDSSALPGGKYQEQWAATQDNRTRHGKGKK